MSLAPEEDFFEYDEDETPPIEVTWTQQMWVLDPGPFIDLAFNQGVEAFVFRAKLHESSSMRQDWTKFIRTHARGRAWKAIWVPYPGDFAVLFDSEYGFEKYQAVWPIWRADRDAWRDLDKLINEPWSADPSAMRGAYGIDSRHGAEPVYAKPGQEHRILVAGLSKKGDEWGRVTMEVLRLASQPGAPVFHFHGQKSISRSIGMRVPSFDHPVRIAWVDGYPTLLLPNGNMAYIRSLNADKAMWLKLVGMAPKDFNIADRTELARRVYELNLRSLRWAYLNYDKAWDFRRKGRATGLDVETVPEPTRVKFVRTKRFRKEETEFDRWLCDTCIYQDTCPYSREGAVCILPDSDGAELVNRFKTRNGAHIVEALGVLMAFQTRRLLIAAEREVAALEAEDSKAELSESVTRLANSIFDRGVVLAKLVDPGLAGRLTPKINVANFNLGGGGMTPQALTAGIAAKMLEDGVDLTTATEEELAEALATMIDPTTGEEESADVDSPEG